VSTTRPKAGSRKSRVVSGDAVAHNRPVVSEGTGKTAAVVHAVRSQVARLVVANPFQVRLIAEAW